MTVFVAAPDRGDSDHARHSMGSFVSGGAPVRFDGVPWRGRIRVGLTPIRTKGFFGYDGTRSSLSVDASAQ